MTSASTPIARFLTSHQLTRRRMLAASGAATGYATLTLDPGSTLAASRLSHQEATPMSDTVNLAGLAFTDPEFDGQFLRALDGIYYGGADIGECFTTARRIPEGDRTAWHNEWKATGDRVTAHAEASLAEGHTLSAHQAYLRAVTYYRTSGVFMYAPPLDPRFVESFRNQRNAFEQAVNTAPWTGELVQIPYENTTLEGWFITPAHTEGPYRTLVCVDGYDGTKEELFFAGGHAALQRGYAILLCDGPGQGGALIEQGLVFRHDWEAVITPQIDWLLTRPEVDPDRIALIGRSWGGYLARAATGEHRIAAVIADAAQYDIAGRVPALLPAELQPMLATGEADDQINAFVEEAMTSNPNLAFSVNRGLLVHGAETPAEFLRMSLEYTNKGLAQNITCPVLVCEAENDVRGGNAKPLYDAITSPKEYILFTNEEGAGEHDEAGAASLFSQRAFDWLDRTLA